MNLADGGYNGTSINDARTSTKLFMTNAFLSKLTELLPAPDIFNGQTNCH